MKGTERILKLAFEKMRCLNGRAFNGRNQPERVPWILDVEFQSDEVSQRHFNRKEVF